MVVAGEVMAFGGFVVPVLGGRFVMGHKGIHLSGRRYRLLASLDRWGVRRVGSGLY